MVSLVEWYHKSRRSLRNGVASFTCHAVSRRVQYWIQYGYNTEGCNTDPEEDTYLVGIMEPVGFLHGTSQVSRITRVMTGHYLGHRVRPSSNRWILTDSGALIIVGAHISVGMSRDTG